MYDNPNFHNLSKDGAEAMAKYGYGEDNRANPPPYSGDFMQCIEHVHGYVCDEFQKVCFRERLGKFDPEIHGNAVREVFFDMVTGDSVKANCLKVSQLMKYIVDNNTGGYANSKFT